MRRHILADTRNTAAGRAARGHAARIDANQPAIVSALRAAGCTVQSLATVGNGCPDLLVARAGKLWLLEIKSGSEDLNAIQLAWLNGWNSPVHVVRSVEQALSVLALHVRAKASA